MGGVPRRSVTPAPWKLLADCAPMNAQLGTDLAECLALAVHVGRTLNVHRATVASVSRTMSDIGHGQPVGASLVAAKARRRVEPIRVRGLPDH